MISSRPLLVASAVLLALAASTPGALAQMPQSAPQPMQAMPQPAMPGMSVPGTGAPRAPMMAAMDTMDRDMNAAPMNGNTDHDFVSMMIPHHQGAVDMARIELRDGKDPELHRLAQEIVTAQEKEIALMRHWQATHGGGRR